MRLNELKNIISKAILNEWHHSFDDGLQQDAINITNKCIELYNEYGKDNIEYTIDCGDSISFPYHLNAFNREMTISLINQKNTILYYGNKICVGLPHIENAVKNNNTQRLNSLIYHELGHLTNLINADTYRVNKMDISMPMMLDLDEKDYEAVKHYLYRFQNREMNARCFETAMFLKKNNNPNITIQDIYNDRCSDITMMREFINKLNDNSDKSIYIIENLYKEIFRVFFIRAKQVPYEIKKRKVLNVLNGKLKKFTKKINKIFTDYKLKENITILAESQCKELLKENRESKNQKIARNLMRDRGYSDEQTKKTYETIRTNIPNSRVCQYSFFPMVTRMFLDNQLDYPETIFNLNKTLKVIGAGGSSKQIDPNNFFNATPEQFIGFFKNDVIIYISNMKKRVNAKEYKENSNYTIVPVDNEAEAAKYGQYTSWCITHPERYDGMYDAYTNNGTGRFYFCLKNGFQNVPKEIGKGCPLDEYGLSMIAVSVDAYGECNTVTCRWNHDNGGNDNVMDEEEISDIIGRNFYQTFLPYTDEEQIAKGNITPNLALKLLAEGKNPKEIFSYFEPLNDNTVFVGLYNNFNILLCNENKYLFNKWFKTIETFDMDMAGFTKIKIENKWNYLKEDGTLLWKQPIEKWFDGCQDFDEFVDIAIVNINNNFINFIKEDGTLLYKHPLKKCSDCIRGYIVIENKGKYNIISEYGEIKWKYPIGEWFDSYKIEDNSTILLYLKNKTYEFDTDYGEFYKS